MALNHHENNLVDKVITSFYKAVDHPYLKMFLGEPEVSESYISSLLFLFGDTDYGEEEVHDAVLTTMLVQTALDTHERINRHGLGTERIRTERQLTVLAGDYYSALYYFILSRCNNSKLLHALSLGIQDVNEAKMTIYHKEKGFKTPDFKDLETVYTGIAESLANCYDLKKRSEAVKNFLLVCALFEEKKHYCNNQSSLASTYMESIASSSGRSVDEKFEEVIDERWGLFQGEDAPFSEFKAAHASLFKKIHQKRNDCRTYAVEEG